MNYALIGCGRVSSCHIEAAIHNNLEIVCVCDIKRERAESLARRYHLSCNIYTDYTLMLRNEKIDLVAIATDHCLHAEMALYAIRNKIHVMIEKPIALSLEEADQIIGQSKENGVKLTVCHQNRFNKSIQKVRRALEDGKFGKLYYGTAHARWSRSDEYYRLANWRGTWEGEGGSLITQCIHNIDLLAWMLGSEATEVFAYADLVKHRDIEIDDLSLGIVKFKNGAYGTIESTTTVYHENLEGSMCLFGETGTVKTGGAANNRIDAWKFSGDEEDAQAVMEEYFEAPLNVYGNGHKGLYADMLHSILSGEEPCVTGEDGKKALEIIFGMYLSAKLHMPVKLPLHNCRSTDFTGLLK